MISLHFPIIPISCPKRSRTARRHHQKDRKITRSVLAHVLPRPSWRDHGGSGNSDGYWNRTTWVMYVSFPSFDSSFLSLHSHKRHLHRLFFFFCAILSLTSSVHRVLYHSLDGYYAAQWVAWGAYTFVFTAAAFLVTRFVSQSAAGSGNFPALPSSFLLSFVIHLSGIPQMKSVINGFYIDNLFSRRTLVAKVLGTTLYLGSGNSSLLILTSFSPLSSSRYLFHPLCSFLFIAFSSFLSLLLLTTRLCCR